jgi:hypothetical protein
VPLAGEVKPESVPLDILHYSYYSYSAHVAHSNKFSDIAAKVMFEKNRKSSLLTSWLIPHGRFSIITLYALDF